MAKQKPQPKPSEPKSLAIEKVPGYVDKKSQYYKDLMGNR